MILVDTSGFLAAQAPDQRHHEACAAVLRQAAGPFVLSPYVLAELDYLIGRMLGVEGELRLLGEVLRDAYLLAPFEAPDLDEARGVIAQYRDLPVGLADASIAVLSRRFDVLDVLTLDERHFRTLRGARGRAFRLLPSDQG